MLKPDRPGYQVPSAINFPAVQIHPKQQNLPPHSQPLISEHQQLAFEAVELFLRSQATQVAKS